MGWHRPMHMCSGTLLQEVRGCPLSGLQFLRNRVLNEKSCHSWFKLTGDRFFSFEFLTNIKTSAHTAPPHTHTRSPITRSHVTHPCSCITHGPVPHSALSHTHRHIALSHTGLATLTHNPITLQPITTQAHSPFPLQSARS